MEGTGEPGGPGCGARGRRGPAAVSTNDSNTQPKQISHAIPPRHESTRAQKPQNINDQISIVEIHSGELHAKLPRCSQVSTPYRDQAPQVWRAPGSGGPECLAAVPAGDGGAWPGFEATRRTRQQRPGTTGVEGAGGSGGLGRASRSTTPSEARVWRSRGRPGPTAPGTPVGLEGSGFFGPFVLRGLF